MACQNNNKRIARFLLKGGINVNCQNGKSNTPLHYCFAYGFSELGDYLISKGADKTLCNDDGLTPQQGLNKEEVDAALKNEAAGVDDIRKS